MYGPIVGTIPRVWTVVVDVLELVVLVEAVLEMGLLCCIDEVDGVVEVDDFAVDDVELNE